MNLDLGLTWKGPYLEDAVKVVDHCTENVGVPPDPDLSDSSDGLDSGLSFDKHNPGVFTGNCDTTRNEYIGDCRWENCHLPEAISPAKPTHVQMTMALFVR